MRFRHGYLEGRATTGGSVAELIPQSYDVGLFTASWDYRSLCVMGAPQLRVRDAVLLTFASRDKFGVQEQNERLLREYLRQQGANIHPVSAVTEDVESEWERIWKLVKDLLPGSPVRCFVDLSTCPRFYSLGLIGGLLAIGSASEIGVLYAEGDYTLSVLAPHPVDVPFSVGHWRNVPVPFMNGHINPTAKKYYLVSVGFEGTKTSRVLAREDPDRISLLYPIPGVLPEYDRQVIERNSDILERFRVPPDQAVSVAAGDAIGVWKTLHRRVLERCEEDVYYLCCGTKAHALGLALRAVCLRFPTVLYNVPERHSFVEVHPTGRFWMYRITDLSAPPQVSA